MDYSEPTSSITWKHAAFITWMRVYLLLTKQKCLLHERREFYYMETNVFSSSRQIYLLFEEKPVYL